MNDSAFIIHPSSFQSGIGEFLALVFGIKCRLLAGYGVAEYSDEAFEPFVVSVFGGEPLE